MTSTSWTPGHRKGRVLHAPVDPALPVASPEATSRLSDRPTVFWAGRWDRQKKIALVLQIARLMPDVELRMWESRSCSVGGSSICPTT